MTRDCQLGAAFGILLHGRTISTRSSSVVTSEFCTDVWASGAERAWQVKEGQAVAYVAYSKAYVDEEESAAAAKKGVWSAKGFQKPWDYRKARKEEGRVRLLPALMTITPALMTVTPVHAAHRAPCCQEGVGAAEQ